MDIQLFIKKYGIVAVVITIGYFLFQFEFESQEKVSVEDFNEENINRTQNQNVEKDQEFVFVDVKGAVDKPGVYRLKATDRVMTAIEKAGGVKEDADTNQINLAAMVEDGSMIYVPTKGESNQNQQSGPSIESSTSNKININKANREDLLSLNGIGSQKAEAIIAYREENGPFQTIEEIMNVSGIGEKSFEKIKDDISVQ